MEEEIKENLGQVEEIKEPEPIVTQEQPKIVEQPETIPTELTEQPELTEEQLKEQLKELFGDPQQVEVVAPNPPETFGVHAFLHNISVADDITKTGFLTTEEVGIPQHTTRMWKELASFSKIANMDYFADFCEEQSEISTSTSLSKEGFLAKLAVMQRREISQPELLTKKENKGWFKKKPSRNIPEYS